MGIAAGREGPELPEARGALSGALLRRLRRPPSEPDPPGEALPRRGVGDGWGEDEQLALYTCYELHYRGFRGVDPEWEWDPGLLELRADLERRFLAAVRRELGPVAGLDQQLEQLLIEPVDGTGPSHHLLDRGERWQAREYLVHRSVYHLKEADPQAWAIPRLHGAAQAGFIAVEFDEYGDGRPERVHSRLFAEMMADLGLDPSYGHYVDAVPAEALAVVNLMSLFGLHRSLRGAAVGQFAALEITSSPGADRLARALERMGAGPAGVRFYREHVEADAVHEQVVRRDVIQALLRDEPDCEPDVAFGIAASGLLEDRLGALLTERWEAGRSSLRIPLADAPPPEARVVPVGGAG